MATRAAHQLFQQQLREALSGTLATAPELAVTLLAATVPLLAIAGAAALIVGLAQTGGTVSVARLAPTLSNLDPIGGLRKLFSAERLLATLRALGVALLVGFFVYRELRGAAGSLVATQGEPRVAAQLCAELTLNLLWSAVAVSLAFAALDVWVTRHSWRKRNRMTKDEVKREHREAEGDPQIKQERKRAHQELLNSAQLHALKDAHVLIVNPTHLAMALRYDPDRDRAPSVVAQGQGAFAERLIEAARAYGVPIVRDIPVAHALKELELGEEIPEDLYEAVAEILRELQARAETGEP
jgi:FlhB-like protein